MVVRVEAGSAVTAVAFTGRMHSSVFLEREGEVVRPAMLWSDGRTTQGMRRADRRHPPSRCRGVDCNPALEQLARLHSSPCTRSLPPAPVGTITA